MLSHLKPLDAMPMKSYSFNRKRLWGPRVQNKAEVAVCPLFFPDISQSVLPFFLRETPETGILTFSPRFNDPDFVLVQHPLAASRHTEIFTHLFPVGNKSPQLPPSFSPVNKNPPQPTLSSSPKSQCSALYLLLSLPNFYIFLESFETWRRLML